MFIQCDLLRAGGVLITSHGVFDIQQSIRSSMSHAEGDTVDLLVKTPISAGKKTVSAVLLISFPLVWEL